MCVIKLGSPRRLGCSIAIRLREGPLRQGLEAGLDGDYLQIQLQFYSPSATRVMNDESLVDRRVVVASISIELSGRSSTCQKRGVDALLFICISLLDVEF